LLAVSSILSLYVDFIVIKAECKSHCDFETTNQYATLTKSIKWHPKYRSDDPDGPPVCMDVEADLLMGAQRCTSATLNLKNMRKPLAAIAFLLLLFVSIWCGYSFGEYNAVLNNIPLEKRQVLSDVELQTKSIELIDTGETKKLREVLVRLANSNMEHIDGFKKNRERIKYFRCFIFQI